MICSCSTNVCPAHSASFALCVAVHCQEINTSVPWCTEVFWSKSHFRKQFWCFCIVPSVHRVLLRCAFLKNNAFYVNKQYQLHFSVWRCCAECVWWSYCLIQDSWQVITGDIILGVFWTRKLHFAGWLRYTFVSECHVGHLEPILCTVMSCLISLIWCAEHFPMICLTWQTASLMPVFCLSSALL
jgi:hypothetical protein